MAKARKYKIEKNYVEIPNATAQAVQATAGDETISLQALGLIVNLWSYNVDEWELHKTELYKRYGKNKESSVNSAWKELVKNRYIIEYKYRVGKSWEYIYVYNIQPFTDEQIREIWTESTEEHGKLYTLQNKVWGLDFQDPKMGTSNCGPQNQEVSNISSTKDFKKERYYKRNLSIKEEEIEKADLPDPIKNILRKEIDRLIDHNIAIEDIYGNYKANEKRVDEWQYAERLKTVLHSAKNKIGSISNYMNKAIDRYLQPESQQQQPTGNDEKAPRVDHNNPEWYKQGKHKEKPQETPEETPYEEMSEEQRKVADLLKQYTEGAQ